MAVDIAGRLKEHAKGRITTIQDEYTVQIHKWTPYFNLFADAQIAALKNHETVIKKVEEAQKANAEFAMLALTLVGGVAIAWLKSLVVTKLYPKYMGKTVFKDTFTPKGYQVQSSRHWDEQAADFFGDSVDKVVGVGLDATLKKVFPAAPEKRTEPQGLVGAIANADVASFKTNLVSALEAEIGRMAGALGTMRTNIDNNQAFGDEILEVFARQNPHTKTKHLNPREETQLEEMAEEMLDVAFDKLRQEYARKWRYYGNNPGVLNLSSLTRKMELEIWALWILDQEYHIKENKDPIVSSQFEIKGKDELPLGRIILGHLVNDLAVADLVDPEYHTQYGDHEIDPGDLPTVIAWAKVMPTPAYSGSGQVDYTPRAIGTVRDAASIFGK
jgi:hypothetical protein